MVIPKEHPNTNTVIDSPITASAQSIFQEVKINGVTTGVHILEDGNKADHVKIL